MRKAAESLLTFESISARHARILRMGRATLYARIRAGDGRRSYITMDELRRYVATRKLVGSAEASADQ